MEGLWIEKLSVTAKQKERQKCQLMRGSVEKTGKRRRIIEYGRSDMAAFLLKQKKQRMILE